MNKRIKAYTVSASILILILAAMIVILVNRGAPAVDATAYVQSNVKPLQVKEITYINDAPAAVPGMKAAADNDWLTLYVNPETAEVAVRDKRSGDVWFSNPQDRDGDTAASPIEKDALSSQISIAFRNVLSDLSNYTSYGQSVKHGQFLLESMDDGLRVTFTIGDASLGVDALPRWISKQRMQEKLLDQLDESTARYVSLRYLPVKNNPDLLERLDSQVERVLVLNKMVAAFNAAGYTDEDLAADNAENGIEGGGATGKPKFTIPLEYRLEGDSLVVSVAADNIEESATHRIRTLHLLSFFGAADQAAEGYMFVPDGTGSLIKLNSGKVKEEVYAQRVYGEDETDNSRSRVQISEKVRLPVFGMKNGNSAWFAVIEEGDAIASISADVSGRRNSYNNIYSSFAIRGEDELELYQGNEVQEIQMLTDHRYTGDIRVRYSFLSGNTADYSGMARLYREKLVKDGTLKPLQEKESIPFYVDMLGAIDKRETFLGVPYQALLPMTTFEQAEEIARQLNDDGISNINMRYIGWFNKGVQHKSPVKVKTDRLIGSKKDLQALAAVLESSGGMLYPDVAFQHIFRDDAHFTPASDAARYITREVAERAPYDRARNRINFSLGEFYLLSPAKLPYYVRKFADQYAEYGLNGLSLRDLGNSVHSDYRVSRGIVRETAKHIITEQLEQLAAQYSDMMISGGNAYALASAGHLVDVPMSSSRFGIEDEEVPFYQMVVHGYLDYAGAAVNIGDEQDLKKQWLRSLELGSAPHFLWSYEPSSKLKYTKYDAMYSTLYTDWYEQAVDLYRQVNEVMSGLRTATMERHIRHQEGVVEVKYSNGISLLVNYTNEPHVVNGITVQPEYYAVGGEAK